MPDCCVFVLCGVVRVKRDNRVSERGFPVYGGFYVCGGSV